MPAIAVSKSDKSGDTFAGSCNQRFGVNVSMLTSGVCVDAVVPDSPDANVVERNAGEVMNLHRCSRWSHSIFYGDLEKRMKIAMRKIFMDMKYALAFVVFALLTCNQQSVARELELELDDRASSIARVLMSKGIRKVSINVDGGFETEIHDTVTEHLIASLKANGLTISKFKTNPSIETNIDIYAPQGDRLGGYSVEILLDDSGDPDGALNFRKEVPSIESRDMTLSENLKGLGGKVDPDGDGPIDIDDVDAVIAALANGEPNPEARPDITNNIFRINDGTFGLQLISNGKPVELTIEDGRGLASFDQKAGSYQVRIFNNAKWDTLFFLKIDGVDSGFFRDRKKPTLWYCPAGKSVVVSGWINKDTFENKRGSEFSLAPKEDSVAAQYGTAGDIGFITATFYRAYKPEENPYQIDPREGPVPYSIPSIATKKGGDMEMRVGKIGRKPGPKVRAVLSLPYERRK